MMIELDDDEARLLYAVVLEKAQEPLSHANTSEIAEQVMQAGGPPSRTRSRDFEAVNNS